MSRSRSSRSGSSSSNSRRSSSSIIVSIGIFGLNVLAIWQLEYTVHWLWMACKFDAQADASTEQISVQTLASKRHSQTKVSAKKPLVQTLACSTWWFLLREVRRSQQVICTRMCVCVCMCTSIYIYTHTCLCLSLWRICMCTYRYIHAYTYL